MLLISTAIRQFCERNPKSKRYCQANEKGNSIGYAGHMGFFKTISEQIPYGKLPGEARGSHQYIPITSYDLSEIRAQAVQSQIVVQQQIQNIAGDMSRVLARGDKTLEQTLTYVLREIIRNSEEHSNAEKVWICAQYWPSYQLAEVAILDEGIGVKRSLKSNKHFSHAINSDSDALRLSLLPGVTEAYKRHDIDMGFWENSGYGLYIAKEICTHMGKSGLFMIASGKACIGAMHNDLGISEISKKTAINGTAICIRFSTKTVDSFEQLRKEIISEGQGLSQNVKHTIKKASYASGGLIELIKGK